MKRQPEQHGGCALCGPASFHWGRTVLGPMCELGVSCIDSSIAHGVVRCDGCNLSYSIECLAALCDALPVKKLHDPVHLYGIPDPPRLRQKGRGGSLRKADMLPGRAATLVLRLFWRLLELMPAAIVFAFDAATAVGRSAPATPRFDHWSHVAQHAPLAERDAC